MRGMKMFRSEVFRKISRLMLGRLLFFWLLDANHPNGVRIDEQEFASEREFHRMCTAPD
jgi:hypothetical protein